ncbi:hypothetical protein NUW54_g5995 [Trametes sanguinea]|uniref:Uncharacterized protein n=1 Tax=Trametes sanguinea TaxID=158606 RepID=A0ACC1PW81_9APHY|nr:hypothetical protein NUW54_g5995 [Trametes sanguinea]
MRLVKQRTPLFVSLSNFFGSVAAFSMIYNVPLYFSAVRLNSSTDAGACARLRSAAPNAADDRAVLPGMHLLPHSVAISTGSVFAGWVMRRTGKLYTLTLCSCLMTVVAASLVAMWNDNSATWHLWLDIVPQGFGMASVITTTLIAMIAGVSREDVAVATGIAHALATAVTYLFRTTGQVIGVSLSGALLQSILTSKLRERIHGPNAVEIIENIRHSTTIIPELSPELRKAAVDSYADALRVVFICQAAMNFICFLCCLPIQENPLPGSHEEQEEAWKQRDTNRTQAAESP